MEAKEELKAYEEYLIQALWDQRYRRETESLESIQIFVDNKSVGTLECHPQAIATKTFQVGPSPSLIELRSSSGLPVGSLSSEGQKSAEAELQAGNYVFELDLQREEDKSVVQLTSKNLLAIPSEPSVSESSEQKQQDGKNEPSSWSMLALAAQIILAAGVVFLVIDRFAQTSTRSNDGGSLVASKDHQLQEVLQQLTAIQKRLDQTSVMAVNSGTDGEQQTLGTQVVSRSEQSQDTGNTLLEKKAETFKSGILESRPVWVRFKKGTKPTGIEKFFKDVSAQDHAQMGGWYSFNMSVPNSESPDKILKPLSKRSDIEIITTSVVTRHVQVRFKKDIDDDKVNGFFDEIRVKRGKPKDNWYNVDLPLPEPVDPKEFIGSLRSGNIVEKLNVNMDMLPAR